MKIKSTEIKAKLEKLNKDITNSWMIIRTENLVENGFKRHYDMKIVFILLSLSYQRRMNNLFN